MPRNNGKRKYETLCSGCNEFVGVIHSVFNQDPMLGQRHLRPMPKTSRHYANGRLCPGSQLTVHPTAVMEGAAA